MTIKSKKIIFTSLAALSMTSVLVSASCGVRRFDQTEHDNIRILLGWTKDSIQYKALTQLVDMYNETQKDTPDFLKVTLDTDEKSYPSVYKRLSNGLETKDAKNLWNLTFHYPVTVAQLAGYNMRLRFDKNDEDKDNYAISRNDFEKEFIDFNDAIGGVPHGQISAIPFAKSTIVSAINAPVISYVLETMVSLGTKISAASKDWYEKLKQAGASDRPYIKQLWGDVSPEITPAEKEVYKNYVFDKDTVFNNGENLIEFAKLAQELFTKSRNTNGGVSILGITDPAGFYATQVYSQVADKKADFKNYTISLDANGNVHYDNILHKGRPAYEAVKKITEKILDAAKVGAIVEGGRPSFQLRIHRIGIAIQSTSSRHENYFNGGRSTTVYRFNINSKGDSVNSTISDRDLYFIGKKSDGTNTNILGNIGRNDILSSTNPTDVKDVKGLKSANAETDAKIKDFLSKLTYITKDGAQVAQDGAIIKNSDNTNIDSLWESEASKKKLEADGVVLLGQITTWDRNKEKVSEINTNIYGVPKLKTIGEGKSLGFTKLTTQNSLQESELFQTNSPRKWEPSDKMNAVYLQGPSLIGIHANKKEDTATRKFVKWLTTSQQYEFKFYDPTFKGDDKFRYKTLKDGKYVFAEGNDPHAKLKPLKYLFEASSYLSPYKGFFEEIKNPQNPFAKIAFDEFQKGLKEKDYFILEEPANALSDVFRGAFTAALQQPVNQYYSGSGANVGSTYEDTVLKALRLNASSFVG